MSFLCSYVKLSVVSSHALLTLRCTPSFSQVIAPDADEGVNLAANPFKPGTAAGSAPGTAGPGGFDEVRPACICCNTALCAVLRVVCAVGCALGAMSVYCVVLKALLLPQY
jgi:hypothetical protein